MYRDEFGPEKEYCVRWDAYETKVDVVGTLTLKELDQLIATLRRARSERKDQECIVCSSSNVVHAEHFYDMTRFWCIDHAPQYHCHLCQTYPESGRQCTKLLADKDNV